MVTLISLTMTLESCKKINNIIPIYDLPRIDIELFK